MTRAKRQSKPKCAKGTACGFTCISGKLTCSSRVPERDAALVKAVTDGTLAKARLTNGTHNDFKHNTSYDEEVHNYDFDGYARDRRLEFIEQAKEVALVTGLDESAALAGIEAVYFGYTGGDYDKIRSYDRDPSSVSTQEHEGLYKIVTDLSKFVKALPVYKGALSRGIKFDSEQSRSDFLASIADGVELEAMTSFTSRPGLAERFAGGKLSGVGVVLSVQDNKSGSSVMPFSKVKDEEEVIALKGTKYKVRQIIKTSSLYQVELEELTNND